MTSRIVIALGILLTIGSIRAEDGRGVRHVIVVLDCSEHMAQPFAGEAKEHAGGATRLSVARDSAMHLLENVSQSQKQVLTLVLFGHRPPPTDKSAAELDVNRVARLVATGKGSSADAEIALDSRPLTPAVLSEVRGKLDHIQPTGSAPLLMAMLKAIETIPAGAEPGSAAVVVFTSGASDQPGASSALAKQLVLRTIRGRGTLHAIQIGSGAQSAAMHDLAEIADATGGAVYAPETPEQVNEATLVALGAAQPKRLLAKFQVRPASQETPAPPVIVRTEGEQLADVVVDITFYGAPVRDAKIMLRGPSFDIPYDRELEYKNLMLRQRRYDGVYIIPNVPLGPYVMEIRANVKNRRYVLNRPIDVTLANKVPDRSFKIELEKTKEPPPAAPPAPAP